MSKKTKLAATTKQSKVLEPWIDALEAITINEQDWCCMIIMIIETLPEHTKYIELFDEAAEKGSRKAIYSLSFKKMINSIKTLSKVDQDKCPVAQGVFHHASKLISRNDKLDAWLVAKLVKYLVYRAKTEAITRNERESSNENEIDQELRAMLNVGKVESLRSMKSAKSKKSAQSMEAKHVEKTNTRLRKCGEEWKDKIYIDDAPRGGPDLYIILTGFRDPVLPLELVKVGVPLTCIMKIKRPGETFNIVKNNKIDVDCNQNDSPNVTKKSFSKSDITTKMFYDFWSCLDNISNDPKNLDDFSAIIFRTFCPPELPVNNYHEEAEEVLKKDLYDRLSCIVYDLYDLQRLHFDYIKSMKLENVPTDFSKDKKFNVYQSIMDAVPAECNFVAVIVQAMLAQVEADFQDEKPSSISPIQSKSESSAKLNLNVSSLNNKLLAHQKSFCTSFDIDNQTDQLSKHRARRLQELDLQFGIKLKDKQPGIQKKESEIILEDDKLRSKTYHVHLDDDIVKLINPRPDSLADLAVRSLRDPRVIDLWKFCNDVSNETRKKNRYHINKLTDCFGGSMDSCSLVHYLHLQVFDKMIHCRLNRAATRREEDCRDTIMGKGYSPGVMRSDPFLLSAKIIQDDETFASRENPISNLRAFQSDSVIDYSKTACDIFECPELFALTDTREMLQPGFLEIRKDKVCETQTAVLSVAEFTDVRILSENVFLQMVHECLCKFKGFQSRYVEITDSVLLYFGNEERTSRYDDPCTNQVIRIVTPVCLRNFCEYVINEEAEWIREMEKEKAGIWTTDSGDLTRKLSQHSDIDIVKVAKFTDDDFILPNSLKGQARRSHQTKLTEKIESLEKISKKSDKPIGKIGTVVKDVKGKNKKSTLRGSKEKNAKDTKTLDIESSSLPERKLSTLWSARHEEPYRFVGYDLGNHRVQLTTHSETFTSMDGTHVEVDCDEWLYRSKRLGIGIDLSGCFLKLEHTIGKRDDDQMPFHLITENGIVMAFIKRQKFEEHSTSVLNENCGSCFDFRASWPSSLLVELVNDENHENSFYILQKYISKGPECQLVSRENYRKFLRNGTVLKFLDDDAVEVMRPNGTIVRCLKFEKFADPRDSEFGRYGELTKVSDEISKHKKSRSLTSTRGHRNASSPRKQSRRTFQDDQNNEKITVATPLDHIIGEIHSMQEEAARVKITRYTALEHDGRHYEVVNDVVSRVFDRSLVRMSTDFEVSEKLTRREDGMESILNSRGELIVSFPDGTRITTGFVIEDEPLICDWSDEEFKKFFENIPNRSSRPSEEVLSSHLSDVKWSSSYRSTDRRSTTQADKLKKLLDDSFVSILMTCRMEHECYTTVAYEQIDRCCKLSMPDEVVIRISREELFDINVGKNIELQIRNDNLTFLSKFHENNQQSVSTSIYYLQESKLCDEYKRVLLKTVDSLGNVFKVYEDGSVSRENDIKIIRKIPSNSKQKEHRLFAMNRDFTGYEYLHNCKRDEYQTKMNSNGRSSVISVAIPDRALEYRLFLNPLKPTNYSKMWLQKITEFKGTNHDRTDLSRSTYSIPYDWLFPFGRNGNGVRKNNWKVPVVQSIQEAQSEVLTLMVIQGIVKEEKNLLIELQKALACYWSTAIKEFRSYRTSSLENQHKLSDEQTEDWVQDLALGIKSNITLEKYLGGISTNRSKVTTRKFRRASKQSKLDERNALEVEEIRWYEKCIRERIILPYFKNIRGTCFLWIMNCVDEAVELVEK